MGSLDVSRDLLGNGDILVGVDFDDQAQALIRAAARLARASSRCLRVVHCEVPCPPQLMEYAPTLFATPDLPQPCGDEAARERLLEFVTAALAFEYSGLPVEVTMVSGSYPDSLVQFAVQSESVLIVVGAASNSKNIFSRLVDRSRQLVAKAQVPVMVLSDVNLHRLPNSDSSGRWRILIADDLSELSMTALAGATTFLQLLNQPVDVLHVHVTSDALADFGTSEEDETLRWPGLPLQKRLLNDRHDYLVSCLVVRARTLAERVKDLGGSYAAEVLYGDVAAEINRAAELHAANITVFGRHHYIRRKPLAFGKMPFAAMLGLSSAVLVAP